MQAMAEIGCTNITSTAVAIRGERLVLARHSFTAPDWPGLDTETIDVVESGADGRIVAEIAFDPDDIAAAIAELDARFLAGEAAAHAHTWSIITQATTDPNHEDSPRGQRMRLTSITAVGHLRAWRHDRVLEAAMGRSCSGIHIYIEDVHRLNEIGRS